MQAHLSEDRLLAYLDGEIEPGERTETERHLGSCDTCAGELERLRSASRALSHALASLDRFAPREGRVLPEPLREALRDAREAPDPDVVPFPSRRRASRLRPASGSEPSSPRDEPSRRRSVVAAAALLLVVGSAAMAAIPGSPVRALVERSVEAVSTFLGGETVDPGALETPAAEPPSRVAVEAHDGRVEVAIVRPAPGVSVRVRLVESTLAAVSAVGARFRTAPGRIEVLEPAAGELLLELPRAVGQVRVEVDGRPVLEKHGSDLHFVTPAADTSGSEIRFEVTGEEP